MLVRTASSRAEARGLLGGSPPPCDSPTQHRLRTPEHLDRTLATGRRRPEWVWVAEEAGRVVGIVAGHGTPAGQLNVLDHFHLPIEGAVEFMAAVTEDVRRRGAHDLIVFAPPGSTSVSPGLAPLLGPIAAAGWDHLVDRLHYEFVPSGGFGAGIETALRFVPVVDSRDPLLREVHREVMRGTLDAHDADAVGRLGFEEACAQSLQFLLDADPVECIRLAFDEHGAAVGLVSGRTMADGTAYVLFVGVVHDHRGQGYGRQLVGWMTRELLAQGATTLIADTDMTNTPMAAGFAAAGWPVTESRLDYVLR